MNDLISIYCISNSSPDFFGKLELDKLQCVVYDSFYVSIKYVPESEFSDVNFKSSMSDIQWMESHVQEHSEIIHLLMKQQTIIPFRFGTIFHNEDSLKCFIDGYSCSISDNLRFIEGKEEWSIKMYCDRKVMEEKIDELSPEAAAFEMQIMESSPGKAYLLRRKKDNLIEIEVDKLCKKYVDECYDAIKNLSDALELRNLVPKEFAGRQEPMVLNVSSLINKNKVADFNNTVTILVEKYQQAGFIIESTGPCPPFTFISL